MIGKNNTYRILRLFFRYPTRHFQLREISRQIGLSLPAVISHVQSLEREKLVKRERVGIYDSFRANMENETYKLYKKLDTLLVLQKEVVPYIVKECSYPTAIVLFGSASKGEDVEESDIDLLILAKEKSIDVSIWEEKLNRRFNILFLDENEIKQTKEKEFLNNLVNGITLYGLWEVYE